MESKYRIKKITVHSGLQELQILWVDGHHSRYPLEGLRRSCPCVHCQGGHDQMGKPVNPEIFLEASSRRWNIKGITEVGNYALQITWSDGHQNGIYRYKQLRDMCPVENGLI